MDKVDFVFPSQSHHILFKTQSENSQREEVM